jgi:hypothetical protein
MPDFDETRSPPSSRAPAGLWGLAALSSAVFLCSVLGAKLLSQMVDRGEIALMASRLKQRQEAQEPQVYSIVRSVGVDGVTTSTIPHRGPAPVSPCGDAKK